MSPNRLSAAVRSEHHNCTASFISSSERTSLGSSKSVSISAAASDPPNEREEPPAAAVAEEPKILVGATAVGAAPAGAAGPGPGTHEKQAS